MHTEDMTFTEYLSHLEERAKEKGMNNFLPLYYDYITKIEKLGCVFIGDLVTTCTEYDETIYVMRNQEGKYLVDSIINTSNGYGDDLEGEDLQIMASEIFGNETYWTTKEAAIATINFIVSQRWTGTLSELEYRDPTPLIEKIV